MDVLPGILKYPNILFYFSNGPLHKIEGIMTGYLTYLSQSNEKYKTTLHSELDKLLLISQMSSQIKDLQVEVRGRRDSSFERSVEDTILECIALDQQLINLHNSTET